MSAIQANYTRRIDQGASASVGDNSLEILKDALRDELPLPLINIIHKQAFPVRYKVVVLSAWNYIKIALCTILTLGIWLYRQRSNFDGALRSGNVQAAEEAARNGGSIFSDVLIIDLIQTGKVEAAGFLMAQDRPDIYEPYIRWLIGDLFRAWQKLQNNHPSYETAKTAYQNALRALLLADVHKDLRSEYFCAALKREDYETAGLFFECGHTFEDLIHEDLPGDLFSELFKTKNIHFLLKHGLKVDWSVPRRHYLEIGGSLGSDGHRDSGGTFLWNCVRVNNVEGAALLLDRATDEEKKDILAREMHRTQAWYELGTLMQLAEYRRKVGDSSMLFLLEKHIAR